MPTRNGYYNIYNTAASYWTTSTTSATTSSVWSSPVYKVYYQSPPKPHEPKFEEIHEQDLMDIFSEGEQKNGIP